MELNSESPPFTSFADLYPVVLLPSMFIIGHHGIPMNIIYGSKNITASELAMKTTRSIELRRSGETSPLARRRSQCVTYTKPKELGHHPHCESTEIDLRDQVNHGRRPQQQVVSNPTPPAKTATATTGRIVERTVEQRPPSTTKCVIVVSRLQLKFNSDRRLIKQFQPTSYISCSEGVY
ncbi:UBX domain-containing protein 4-like isoform X4 [Dysidea avara]|uniref:UBX domain-containing protein 4-like isoform X4 n=1 Tax=Dysidea avara TaxID=196820 RepID=UPI00332120E2